MPYFLITSINYCFLRWKKTAGKYKMVALNLQTHNITCVVSDKSTCDIVTNKCPNTPSTITALFLFFLLRRQRFLTRAMSAYRFLAAAGNSPFRSQRRGLPVSSRHPTPPQGPARIIVSFAPPSAHALPAHTRRRRDTPAPAPPECVGRVRARATTYCMLVGLWGAYTAVDGGADGGGA